jgi:hypothetical protein
MPVAIRQLQDAHCNRINHWVLALTGVSPPFNDIKYFYDELQVHQPLLVGTPNCLHDLGHTAVLLARHDLVDLELL